MPKSLRCRETQMAEPSTHAIGAPGWRYTWKPTSSQMHRNHKQPLGKGHVSRLLGTYILCHCRVESAVGQICKRHATLFHCTLCKRSSPPAECSIPSSHCTRTVLNIRGHIPVNHPNKQSPTKPLFPETSSSRLWSPDVPKIRSARTALRAPPHKRHWGGSPSVIQFHPIDPRTMHNVRIFFWCCRLLHTPEQLRLRHAALSMSYVVGDVEEKRRRTNSKYMRYVVRCKNQHLSVCTAQTTTSSELNYPAPPCLRPAELRNQYGPQVYCI